MIWYVETEWPGINNFIRLLSNLEGIFCHLPSPFFDILLNLFFPKTSVAAFPAQNCPVSCCFTGEALDSIVIYESSLHFSIIFSVFYMKGLSPINSDVEMSNMAPTPKHSGFVVVGLISHSGLTAQRLSSPSETQGMSLAIFREEVERSGSHSGILPRLSGSWGQMGAVWDSSQWCWPSRNGYLKKVV